MKKLITLVLLVLLMTVAVSPQGLVVIHRSGKKALTGRFFLSQFGSAIDWGEGLVSCKDGAGNYYLAGTADFGTFSPLTSFTSSVKFKWYVARLTPSLVLDHTWGVGGVVVLDFGHQDEEVTSIVVDGNGRIVVGVIDYSIAPTRTVRVAVFNTDGSLYQPFGNNGIATLTPTEAFYGALCLVALQSDGKIIVTAGEFRSSDHRYIKLWRLNQNGNPDATWGTTGAHIASYMYNTNDNDTYATCLLVGSDDKIYVGGFANNSSAGGDHHLGFVAGFLSNGNANSGWGVDTGGGQYAAILDTPTAKECIFASLLEEPSSGKIIAVGEANSDATHVGIIAARFTTVGGLDTPSFGASSGYTIHNFGLMANDSADWAAFDSNGKIVVAGQISDATGNYYSPTTRFSYYRFTSNGLVDTTLNGTGAVAPAPNGDNQNDSVFYGAGRYAVINSDDTMVLPGHVNSDTGVSIGCLVKLKADGSAATNVGDPVFPPSITAPTVTTNSASSIGQTGGTLNGSVTGQAGGVTYYQFEYGLTAGLYPYRTASPATTTTSDGSPHSVARAVTGLLSGYTYHYRLAATTFVSGIARTTYGSDVSFATSSGAVNTLFSDTFTDTNGTQLAAHTPDANFTGGHFWTTEIGASKIQSNKALADASYIVQTIDVGLDTNFTIEATFTRNGAGGTEFDIMFRYQPSLGIYGDHWFVRANGSTLDIIERIGGNTIRGSVPQTFANGETHTIRVVVSGTTVTATFDGGNPVSYGSMSALAGETHVGFEMDQGGDTCDNFQVTAP